MTDKRQPDERFQTVSTACFTHFHVNAAKPFWDQPGIPRFGLSVRLYWMWRNGWEYSEWITDMAWTRTPSKSMGIPLLRGGPNPAHRPEQGMSQEELLAQNRICGPWTATNFTGIAPLRDFKKSFSGTGAALASKPPGL
jgi:hypothetical protein